MAKGLWMKVHKIVPSGGIEQRQARWQAAWAEDFGVARSGADVVTGAAPLEKHPNRHKGEVHLQRTLP